MYGVVLCFQFLFQALDLSTFADHETNLLKTVQTLIHCLTSSKSRNSKEPRLPIISWHSDKSSDNQLYHSDNLYSDLYAGCSLLNKSLPFLTEPITSALLRTASNGVLASNIMNSAMFPSLIP